MNYTELSTSVQRYTQNDEATFLAELPNFIGLAEKRIFDETQLLVARKNATSPTVAGQYYVKTPTDFLAPYSLALISSGTHTPLVITDETFMREVYPTATTTGTPVHYALFDSDTIILGPTPSSSTFTLELHYFYYPASIVTSTTSWLGDSAPNALLYGTLMEAYRFMKAEQDVMQATQAQYDAAMNGLRMLSAARDRGDAYRYGQFKTPVQA